MEKYGPGALLALLHGTSIWFAWNHDWFDATWPAVLAIAYATKDRIKD